MHHRTDLFCRNWQQGICPAHTRISTSIKKAVERHYATDNHQQIVDSLATVITAAPAKDSGRYTIQPRSTGVAPTTNAGEVNESTLPAALPRR
jgi:hypothetical protein